MINNITLFVALAFSFAASVSALSADTVKIFLLGGQSNMLGRGDIADLKKQYAKPFSKIKIWGNSTKKWEALSPQTSANKKGKFGPEIYFGHTMAKAFPDQDIRLVKYAAGGTALYDDWSPVTKGAQYVNFMNVAKAALGNLDKAGVQYEIAGMLWLQGESDAHENMAELYEKNLTHFISHMRLEFKTPEMPFIIARVRSYYGGESGQAKIVRKAQVKIAKSSESIAWFNTDSDSMLDAGHYDAKGLSKIGGKFAKSYQKMLKEIEK